MGCSLIPQNKRKIYNKLILTDSKLELTKGERYKNEVLEHGEERKLN